MLPHTVFETTVRAAWGVVLGASVLLGCGSASRLAKPPEFVPENQSKCSITKSGARPLIVEWPSADRLALEASVTKGTVVVRYAGCEMEVLRLCRAPGAYKYVAATRQNDRVTMRNLDELYASIPVHAAKFEETLAKSGQLNVEMSLVGSYESDSPVASRAQLQGACGGATHVISALTVGSFEFYAGAEAALGGAVRAPVGTAGGASSAARETLNRAGEPRACNAATRKDKEPPEGCGALLRVEVVALRDAGSAASGMAWLAPSWGEGGGSAGREHAAEARGAGQAPHGEADAATGSRGVRGLWLAGILTTTITYVATVAVTAAVSDSQVRGAATGYSAIPLYGPFVLAGAPAPMADVKGMEAPLVISGVLQNLGFTAFIAGLTIRRDAPRRDARWPVLAPTVSPMGAGAVAIGTF